MSHKFPLDLSKFKKLSSDEHSTKLKHPDGHEITIAHKPLSPKMKEQLSKLSSVKMADGGEVMKKPKVENKETLGAAIGYPGQRKPAPQPTKLPYDFHSGGQVSDDDIIAEKSKIDKENTENMKYGASQREYPEHIQRRLAATDVTPRKYAEGTPDAPVQPVDQGQALPDQMLGQDAQAPQQDPALAAASQQLSQSMPAMQSETPKADAAPMNLEDVKPAATPDLLHALGQQVQGEKQKAEVLGAQGQQTAQDYQDSLRLQQQYQVHFQKSAKDIQNNISTLIQDINDHKIDPNLYWKDHDKTSTMIGILLAGFNPSNRPNAAIEYMNNQMRLNLEAQQADLGRKNNLLTAYMHQFGSLKDASEMFNITQHAILANKLQMAAAQAQSPMARANLLSEVGKIQAQIAPAYNEFAMKRSALEMMGQMNGNPSQAAKAMTLMRVMDPKLAETVEKHYVPGIGTSFDELTPQVREQLVNQTSLINATKHLQDWVSKNRGAISPAKRAEGEALATELQQFYRQATNAGVSEGEKKTIEDIINSTPGDFLHAFTTNPRLRAMENSMTQRLNVLKQQHGLPVGEVAPLSSEPQFKIVNGIKYKRGPNGEAIPVR